MGFPEINNKGLFSPETAPLLLVGCVWYCSSVATPVYGLFMVSQLRYTHFSGAVSVKKQTPVTKSGYGIEVFAIC